MDIAAGRKAAAAFFHSQPGFTRLFALLCRKYRSLGRPGGSVKLQKLTVEERQALSAFFRINLEGQEAVTISFSQFVTALGNTRFSDIDVVELLEAYNGARVLTNHQQLVAAERGRQRFFAELRAATQNPLGVLWLSKVEAKAPGTRRAQAVYEQGRPDNIAVFRIVLSALANLPTQYLRLPLFAQQIAGQPHALDSSTASGRLFVEALRLTKEETGRIVEDTTQEELTSVELEAELLYNVKILRDDLLNFVTCAGLVALYDEGGYQKPAVYWQQAWESGAVLNVPLRETVKYSAYVPAYSSAAGQLGKKVFIVENSGVFSAIADHVAGQGYRLPPLVCLHGQFKLASWTALDRLVAGGCILYYSGDFDPEGLLMAERLIKRYPSAARLWHYSVKDYSICLKGNEDGYITDVISDSRIKQLASLSVPELRVVAEQLREVRRAGYQEALIEWLVADCTALK